MRTLALALVALAAALVVAGCGSPPRYSLAKTRDCLRKDGVRVRPASHDFVAQTATAGALRAWLHGSKGNYVTISFGETPNDAKSVAEGYVRFHARKVGIFDVLAMQRNAVLLWREHPSAADKTKVMDCLR